MDEYFDLLFTVGYIIFQDSETHFCIIKSTQAQFPHGVDVKDTSPIIKGQFPNIQVKDTFSCKAKWVFTKNRGWQLEVIMPTPIVPANIKGIKRFLTRFVPGIGKKSADRIISAYGLSSIEKIRESKDNLLCLDGFGAKKAEQIYEAVKKHDEIEHLALYLFQNGITSYLDVVELYEKGITQTTISSDPYIICDQLALGKYILADTLARNLGLPSDNPSRLYFGILYLLDIHAYRKGDCFLPKEELHHRLTILLEKRGAFGRDGFTKKNTLSALSSLIENNRVEESGGNIYPSFLFFAENYVAQKASEMARDTLPSKADEFLSKHKEITLDKDQVSALKNAVSNRICILTGGPGTGKTFTLNAIIQYYLYCNKKAKIRLCAPTGRAAKRMTEMTGVEASTIHRMLGLTGEKMHFEDIETLDADVVIVDEFSMVDISLCAQLFKAIDKKNTRLLIVGDHHQLSSVGAGLVLRDMIDSGIIPTSSLTKLFRQAANSQINQNAHKINNGESANTLSFDHEKGDCFFIRRGETAIVDTIISSMNRLIDLKRFSLDDFVVLAPVHKGVCGVSAINQKIQEVFNPKSPVKPEANFSCGTLRLGDRVMQTVNNYDLEIFNGEIGKIIEINHAEEQIKVEFPDATITYSFVEARDLMLAYCMTIHKSQGGEFPCVFLPMSTSYPNLSRNIVYTAITRASKTAVFIGDPNALDNAISTISTETRNTTLKERLNSYRYME